jgi:hypothetical protein
MYLHPYNTLKSNYHGKGKGLASASGSGVVGEDEEDETFDVDEIICQSYADMEALSFRVPQNLVWRKKVSGRKWVIKGKQGQRGKRGNKTQRFFPGMLMTTCSTLSFSKISMRVWSFQKGSMWPYLSGLIRTIWSARMIHRVCLWKPDVPVLIEELYFMNFGIFIVAIEILCIYTLITPPNNINRFGGVTTLQDNNKRKSIEI